MTGTTVLLLVADTGGGHRAAARAVAERLRAAYPGRFEPVLLDPLGGPGSAWLLRRIVSLYGPGIRYAPWLWGLAYRATDSRPVTALLRRTLLRLADRPVTDAVAALRPALVVSFHALATGAAVRAGGRGPGRLPVMTVVTDLGTAHTSWCHDGADLTVVPSAAVGQCCRRPRGGPDCLDLGLPVAAGFSGGPLPPAGRQALRRALGLPARGFLAVVTGGGEGAGEPARSARTLLDGFSDVHVAAICGRNERARRRLARLSGKAAGRLTVRGFVGNMADWLRCADVVVTKAGPGTIAEAACCGAPLILTSHLPGQEAANARLVLAAGAARYAARPADLTREIARLRDDPAAAAAMRAASARLGRPGAADSVAAVIAGIADAAAAPQPALLPASRPLVTAAAGETARTAGRVPAGTGERYGA